MIESVAYLRASDMLSSTPAPPSAFSEGDDWNDESDEMLSWLFTLIHNIDIHTALEGSINLHRLHIQNKLWLDLAECKQCAWWQMCCTARHGTEQNKTHQ